jgi:hypothetical protein
MQLSTYNGPLGPCGENGFGIVVQLEIGNRFRSVGAYVKEGFLRSR